MPKFIIFRCEKDDCWIVAVLRNNYIKPGKHVYVGVAEVPNERTASDVLEALELRNAARNIH